MDKTTLSKHKHIYKVYLDSGDRIHFEKFPVVYINSKYVYFEQGSKQPLSCTSTDMVLDSVQWLMEKNAGLGKNLLTNVANRYYWEVSEDPEETMKSLRDIQSANKLKKDLEYAERGLSYAQMQLKLAQDRVDLLKKLQNGNFS